jgi:hypothetical protein
MEPREYHRIRRLLGVSDERSTPSFSGLGVGMYLGDTGRDLPKSFPSTGGLLYVEDDVLNYTNNWGEKVALNRGARRKPGLLYIGDSTFTSTIDGEGAICIGDRSGGKSNSVGDPLIFGNDAMAECAESNDNISIGHRTLKKTSIIGSNIVLGSGAMGDCGETEYNQAIGKESLFRVKDSYNLAFGAESGREADHPVFNHNTIFGRKVLRDCKASCIGLIVGGTEAGAKMTGNIFQSIILGERSALKLKSSVITVNSILMGTSVAGEASNLKECSFFGTRAGFKLSGQHSVLMGANTGDDSEGILDNDILLGSGAGRYRRYASSHNIFMGKGSGAGGDGLVCEGGYSIGLGIDSLAMCENNNGSIGIGLRAGYMSTSNKNTVVGEEAGAYSSGAMNLFFGRKSGRRCIGNYNLLLGDGDDDDYGYEYESVIGLGRNMGRKGIDCVLVGREAGYKAEGWIVRDVLLGAGAGSGLKYSLEKNTSREVVCIGAGAGQGDFLSPREIFSTVILGHGAGKSDTQSFVRCMFLGNGAGSFAGKVTDSTVVGPNAGVGMVGERCVYLGNKAGFNGRGKDDIFVGPGCGDGLGEGHHRLLIGNEKVVCISGDLEFGNVGVGKSQLPKLDGECLLHLEESSRVGDLSGVTGSVLYSFNGQTYLSSTGNTSCLSYPRKEKMLGDFKLTGCGINEVFLLKMVVIPDNGTPYEDEMSVSVKGDVVQLLKSPSVLSYVDGVVSLGDEFTGNVLVSLYGSRQSTGLNLVTL